MQSITRSVALAGAVLGSALSACGLTATQTRERDLCYERCETAAQKRIDAECGGMAFSECPRGVAILADLRTAQEACP